MLEKERDGMIEKCDKGKEMKESFEKLARDLKKKKEEIFEEIRQKENEEAETRTALTQRFQDRISEITTTMEADAAEQTDAVNKNKQLRQKLAILGQHVNLRIQQYETREVELKLNDAKIEQLIEIIKGERAKSSIHDSQLTEERKTETVLKSQLNDLTSRFDVLQTTITKSNKIFREYKSEMDKLGKRTRNLESDKADIIKKYQVKKKNHDAVQLEVLDRLQKMEQLKKQHSSMAGLTDVLKQEAADFEEWKKACPEEFKKLEQEHKEKKAASKP